jgi:thioredoxin-related protein
MKRIISFIAFSIVFITLARAQTGPSATALLREDCIKAGKENKKVFVMFHASWCGWCHRMDKSMNEEDCKKYFDDNFVVRHFVVDESADKKNLETPGAAAFRTKYGGDGQGIPFWLIFDSEGNLLADSMRPDGTTGNKTNTGCPAEVAEVAYFISVLKKTTDLKEDQLETISKRFSKNRN